MKLDGDRPNDDNITCIKQHLSNCSLIISATLALNKADQAPTTKFETLDPLNNIEDQGELLPSHWPDGRVAVVAQNDTQFNQLNPA